jgi:glycine cleavage system aminomethyltransferase T
MSHTLLEDLGAELPARRQAVQTTLGGVPVLAQGMCFAGGPGWELFVEPRSAVQVWDELQTAGERHGITLCGYRAIDGLRLEAGFRVIGTDLTATDDPFEAGLGSLVALDGRDFVGADALRARVQPERDLFTLGLGDGGYVCAYGGEAVSSRGEVIGRLRSSSFGFTVGRHLATAYLPAGTSLGDLFDVDVFGEPVVAEVLPRAPLAGGAA